MAEPAVLPGAERVESGAGVTAVCYNKTMSIDEIEKAVAKLTREERAHLLARLAERDAEEWDRQIEADINAGKFDKLAADALAEHKAGLSRKP